MIYRNPEQCLEPGQRRGRLNQKQLEHLTYEFDTQVSASGKDNFKREEQLEATLGIETLEMVH